MKASATPRPILPGRTPGATPRPASAVKASSATAKPAAGDPSRPACVAKPAHVRRLETTNRDPAAPSALKVTTQAPPAGDRTQKAGLVVKAPLLKDSPVTISRKPSLPIVPIKPKAPAPGSSSALAPPPSEATVTKIGGIGARSSSKPSEEVVLQTAGRRSAASTPRPFAARAPSRGPSLPDKRPAAQAACIVVPKAAGPSSKTAEKNEAPEKTNLKSGYATNVKASSKDGDHAPYSHGAAKPAPASAVKKRGGLALIGACEEEEDVGAKPEAEARYEVAHLPSTPKAVVSASKPNKMVRN